MLLERISKLDCDTCKLRTEHYVQSRAGAAVVCRCLRCGHARRENLLSEAQERLYPEDNGRPLYVL
jgi:uncharacterized Zn finger protein